MTGQITVREACVKDSEAIFRLNRDSLGYDFCVENTRRRLADILQKPGHKVFVAQQGGRVIGYIHAEDYDLIYGEPMKNILGIAVDESARKLGAGRQLLFAAEEWAKATGACGIRLVSGAQRTGAHAFYLACGYESHKDQKNFCKHF